ncbi:aldo/keto reductase [Persicobacter psychrovividus]|uniref:Oxidoreductase n=1 Tax=Persicobacter psychrovividus TaxID=387638 RepID=A0ABN6L468_9BACT|nr:oxidoreductase [Persicobacter psychrovividus]
MKIKSLGNTSLQVSEIGLGTAALGRPAYITLGHGSDLNFDYTPEAMKTQAQQMMDLAYRSGIRYFDTARSYGKGELFLAEWVKRQPYTDLCVGSKWGYTYVADWKIDVEAHEVKDHSLENLLRQWEISKENFGDQLNLYQVHSATLESGILENTEVHQALFELKKNHGILLGLSLSGPQQGEVLARAMEVKSVSGAPLFDVVQATWNIYEQSAGVQLQRAHQAGMGIIIKEVFANGRLTDKDLKPLRGKGSPLVAIAEKYRVGIDVLAMAVVLAQPWADVALSGAITEDQLKSNLQASSLELTAEELECCLALAENPEDYWQFRKSLRWN